MIRVLGQSNMSVSDGFRCSQCCTPVKRPHEVNFKIVCHACWEEWKDNQAQALEAWTRKGKPREDTMKITPEELRRASTDYRDLLVKYIRHVVSEEGVDYICSGAGLRHSDVPFTKEEQAELYALHSEASPDCWMCRECAEAKRERGRT